MLDRNSGLPLNYQLANLLKEDITSGRRKTGDKLPTVRELTAQYKVSLPVVRQALGSLQEEGLIELLHGKGAFVTADATTALPKLGKVIFLMQQTDSLRTHYYMRVLSGVEKAAACKGLPLEFIQLTPNRPAPEIFRDMGQNPGFIVCGKSKSSIHTMLQTRNAACVKIGDDAEFAPDIINDDFNGGYQVGRYFVECGYKDCAVLMRENQSRFNRERLEGFRQALEENGQQLAPDNIIISGPNENLEAAMELLTQRHPEAIFATTDRLANLLLQTATNHGIRVPQDLGLAGFDNDLFSAFLNPPMTTINVRIDEMGETCISMLEQKIQGQANNGPVRVAVDLIERASCRSVLPHSIAR